MFLICNRICFCRALLALTWVHKSPDDSHWRLSGIKYDWMPSFYGVYHVFVWYVFVTELPRSGLEREHTNRLLRSLANSPRPSTATAGAQSLFLLYHFFAMCQYRSAFIAAEKKRTAITAHSSLLRFITCWKLATHYRLKCSSFSGR